MDVMLVVAPGQVTSHQVTSPVAPFRRGVIWRRAEDWKEDSARRLRWPPGKSRLRSRVTAAARVG